MSPSEPLFLSRYLLQLLGTRHFVFHGDRVPQESGLLIVSNHRSILDVFLLMAAVNRPIAFACHRYMTQVPGLREMVRQLGCIPLNAPDQRQLSFFRRASDVLAMHQALGIFPEGTQPMVAPPSPQEITTFHRGFAHLALRSAATDLAILPIAIAPIKESITPGFPLKFLSWFDPMEPLFDQPGWHPLVTYQRVNVHIGQPLWITTDYRQQYQGRKVRPVVEHITHHCQSEIRALLSKNQ